MLSPTKGKIVDVGEGRHKDLTVKTVHYPTMTRDDVSKIFDIESTFKARGKESSKWCQ